MKTFEWGTRMTLIIGGAVLSYFTPWAVALTLIGAAWAFAESRRPKEADHKELAELRAKVEALSKSYSDLQAKLFGVLGRSRGGIG